MSGPRKPRQPRLAQKRTQMAIFGADIPKQAGDHVFMTFSTGQILIASIQSPQHTHLLSLQHGPRQIEDDGPCESEPETFVVQAHETLSQSLASYFVVWLLYSPRDSPGAAKVRKPHGRSFRPEIRITYTSFSGMCSRAGTASRS